MDRFTEMALFVEVADRGSLGAAAEALGLSNPAATRYLASLEERLQVRLVERNTRRLYLTSEGQDFLERAAGIFLPSRSTRNYPQRAFKDGWTFAIAWDSLRPGRLHTC